MEPAKVFKTDVPDFTGVKEALHDTSFNNRKCDGLFYILSFFLKSN
jgi:hypothetical protein